MTKDLPFTSPERVRYLEDYIPGDIHVLGSFIMIEQEMVEFASRFDPQDMHIDKAKAENMLSQTLRSLFAVAESYPDLKANENFLALQEELTSTENKISFARQYYNDAVMNYNNKIEMFPSNIVAGIFNFGPATMFEVSDESERENIEVKF